MKYKEKTSHYCCITLIEHILLKWIVILLICCSSSQSDEISGFAVQKFHDAVLQLRDDVLGASKFQDYVNNDVNLQTIWLDGPQIAQQISNNIASKFAERVDAVRRLHRVVFESFQKENEWGKWSKCCRVDHNFMKFDQRFQTTISTSSMCSIEAPTVTDVHKMPNNVFLKAAEENMRLHPGLKWQYFGSDGGVLTQYPAAPSSTCQSTYDNRFRPWYVKASAPKPKDVVVIIDRSGSMAMYGRMEAAKQAAITVLTTLNPDDRVAVVSFSDEAYAIGTVKSSRAVSARYDTRYDNAERENSNTSCFRHTLASATPRNIHRLAHVVNKIVPFGETYYGKALDIAFNFLQEAYNRDLNKSNTTSYRVNDISKMRDRIILFLSDGEPSDPPKEIFKLIEDRNLNMNNTVVFLCYALGKGTFGAALKRMASQRFHSTNGSLTEECEASNLCSPTGGVFHHVKETHHLRSAMGSYYSFFSGHGHEVNKSSQPVLWSVPYFDAWGLGMVMTAASPVIINSELVGVVAVDLTMHELMADVTYFRRAAHAAYAFLIDESGRVLTHPFLPHPLTITDDPVITNIEAFERSSETLSFLKTTLFSISSSRGPPGSLHSDNVFTGLFPTKHVFPSVHKGVTAHNSFSKYTCIAVQHTTFILCVVIEAGVDSVTTIGPQLIPDDFNFLYHRFDLNTPEELCRHQMQAVSPNKTSVMLAPSSFLNSGAYSVMDETQDTVNKYINYMKSGTYAPSSALIFKDGVRDSVLMSWILENIWISSDKFTVQNKLSHNVIWRYFGSEQGTFRIFPGVEMPKLYEPTQRPWYEVGHALVLDTFSQEGNTSAAGDVLASISPPYADANGAGLVITISKAITIPSPVNESATDPPHILGVIGADILLTFFESLLHISMPECANTSSVHCMVIDTSGYVVYDHNLMQHDINAVNLAKASNYHVSHAHHSIASILISENILVRQKCVDVSSVTYRTNFHVNLTQLNGQANHLPFAISHLPQTNIILIVIPTSPTFNQDCITHADQFDNCQQKTGSDNFESICESPCVDPHGATQHYATCLNTYNFTWDDPVQCVPVKFKDISGNVTSDEETSQQVIDAVFLPECTG